MTEPGLALQIAMSMVVAAAVLAGIAMAVIELGRMKARSALDSSVRAEMLRSLSPLPPNALTGWLVAPVWAALYLTAAEHAAFDLGINALTIVLAFLAADCSYYWEHRVAHRVPLLWRLYHAIHHSSDAYTVATAYRVSFLTHLVAPAFYLPWILLGFDPVLILGFQLFAFHYQAWLHTEEIGRLPAFDGWLNTPANHRMHHSRERRHQDVNLGAVLMIWDRLFGTYATPAPNLRYGIDDQAPPRTLLALYTSPWRAPSVARGEGRAGQSINA